ncbi:hypothetical protein KUTeg_021148 [Tegillarca granosa]|uniref:Transmembrane protein n=1 Tax=Tegillarca granosa TaxID=220873 RepID=A0ABQ9ECL2_TEGGR|nr:hypothetical protein KUTeg_021148 [Tegillarca granosa]
MVTYKINTYIYQTFIPLYKLQKISSFQFYQVDNFNNLNSFFFQIQWMSKSKFISTVFFVIINVKQQSWLDEIHFNSVLMALLNIDHIQRIDIINFRLRTVQYSISLNFELHASQEKQTHTFVNTQRNFKLTNKLVLEIFYFYFNLLYFNITLFCYNILYDKLRARLIYRWVKRFIYEVQGNLNFNKYCAFVDTWKFGLSVHQAINDTFDFLTTSVCVCLCVCLHYDEYAIQLWTIKSLSSELLSFTLMRNLISKSKFEFYFCGVYLIFLTGYCVQPGYILPYICTKYLKEMKNKKQLLNNFVFVNLLFSQILITLQQRLIT